MKRTALAVLAICAVLLLSSCDNNGQTAPESKTLRVEVIDGRYGRNMDLGELVTVKGRVLTGEIYWLVMPVKTMGESDFKIGCSAEVTVSVSKKILVSFVVKNEVINSDGSKSVTYEEIHCYNLITKYKILSEPPKK